MLINVNSDELEHASLDALSALSRVFTSDGQFNSPAFTKVLKNILTGICVIQYFTKEIFDKITCVRQMLQNVRATCANLNVD